MTSIAVKQKHFQLKEFLLPQFVFNYFKVCGIAPMTLKINFDENLTKSSWKFVSNGLGIVYNLVLIVCIIVWDYFETKEKHYETKSTSTFDGTISLIMDIFQTSSTVLVVASFVIRQQKEISLVNEMSKIQEFLYKNNQERPKITLLFRRFVLKMTTHLIIWMKIVLSLVIFEQKNARYYVFLSGCLIIRSSLYLQYTIFLNTIEYSFHILNEHLSDLYKDNDLSHENLAISNEIDNKLSNMREYYSLLVKLTRDMGSFYSFPMLLVIMGDFLVITIFSYDFIKPIIFGGSDVSDFDIFRVLTAIFISAYYLVLLTTSVCNAISESKLTCEIVHKFLKMPESHVYRDKLNEFSMYLMHSNVTFMVYDLYSLDGSLLVSMAGALSTYLVVLLQFDPK